MRGVLRWVRREPWMAINAAVTCAVAATYSAIHWLMLLGLVRIYSVAPTTRSSSFSATTYHAALGLANGPSASLSHLDHVCVKVLIYTSAFWMLRLALRADHHQVGVLRGLGVVIGLGPFVAAGAMHYTADVTV